MSVGKIKPIDPVKELLTEHLGEIKALDEGLSRKIKVLERKVNRRADDRTKKAR